MDPKRTVLPEIDKIVANSRAAVAAHREEIKETRRFVSLFLSIVATEAPEFVEKAKQIAALLQGAMDQEDLLCDAEDRLADDLNDLSVRYDAIFRFSQEVSAGRTAFETSHKKVLDCQKALDAEKSKESSKAYKLDLELAQLKDVRKRNKAGLDALLVQFIDSREKYAQFKIRRLRHGYQNVGEVAAMALEVEVHLLEQLERENSQAKETLDDYFVTPTE